MKKYILPVVVCGILFILAVTFVTIRNFYSSNPKKATVIKEIKNLQRFETVSFTFEKIIDSKTKTTNRIQEILFGDRLLLIAHGEVIAGIDMANIQADDISVQGKKIAVLLPSASIFVVRLDSEKTQVYDRQTGLLNKGNKDLESQARLEAEQSIRAAACEAGILDKASENAQKQLITLLKSIGFEDVVVTVAKTSQCL